jgi:ferric-dicitrate binding protein FerR (iron transport regulator)
MHRKIGAMLLFLLILLGTLSAVQASIDFVDGRVDIRRGGSILAADFGMELVAGDVIITGEDGLAIISLADRGSIKVQPDTTLSLNSLDSDVEVELQSGAVFSRLERLNGGSYRLRAGTAFAGVRGTEFYTAYGKTIEDLPDVWLCVNEGVVDVSLQNGAAVSVAAGEGINILSGRDITPPQFFAWTRDLNWNMDPSAGEVLDDTDLESLYNDPLDFDYD